MDPLVWIIIPTFNRRDILRDCINDLLGQDYPKIKIVVVDDGSMDGSREMIRKEFEQVVLLQGDGDRWWCGAMNLGLGFVLGSAAENDYVVSFNDDVSVSTDYISSLLNAHRSTGSNSIIGSVSVDINDPSKITFCGSTINWVTGAWRGVTSSGNVNDDLVLKTDSLPGRGVLFPVNVFKKIGFYDERYFPQYFGDEDLSLRAIKRGFSIFVSRCSVVRSHVFLTGTGRHSQTFLQFMRSLISIKSPNQISRRVRFVWRHAPGALKLSFSVIDFTKVVTAYFRRKAIRR